MRKATLYGVGIGPGDPELLTRKAVRVLESCPILAVPQTPGGGTLALDIVSQAVDLEGKKVISLPFAMSRDAAVMERHHREAAKRLIEELNRGDDIAVPNLGDISIYSTFGYMIEPIRQAGYPVVLIPGVPSFCAVSSTLGISLTTAGKPLHILPGGGEISQALQLPGPKVLMKSGKQIPKVREALKEAGLSDRAMFVQNCGLPDERVGMSADEICDDLGYFTTIIVKEK